MRERTSPYRVKIQYIKDFAQSAIESGSFLRLLGQALIQPLATDCVDSSRGTLEYWLDDGWHIGRLKEVPGVFSQGETLAGLEENIRDAYQLVTEDAPELQAAEIQAKEISVP